MVDIFLHFGGIFLFLRDFRAVGFLHKTVWPSPVGVLQPLKDDDSDDDDTNDDDDDDDDDGCK